MEHQITKMIRKLCFKILNLIGIKHRNKIYLNNSPLIRNIAKFIINECVVGDYYEFGVYRGQTLISFYKTIQSIAKKRIETGNIIGVQDNTLQKREKILNGMSYHAFDSFEGLPDLTLNDELSEDFSKGQYTSSVEELMHMAEKYKIPKDIIKIHPGWFNITCNESYAKKNNLPKASIIWLDCDLYSSAKDALNIFDTIVQDGTIIVIDDWFNFKGHPDRGVQRAFNDWRFSKEISNKYIIHEYNKDSWSRISFIISKR